MKRTALALLVALLLPTPDLVGQSSSLDSIPPEPMAAESGVPRDAGPGLTSRLATGVGSGILGAGLGFFASHIVRGDWQEGGDRRAVNRSLWAAVGGSLGFAVGMRYPLSTPRPGMRMPGMPTGRDHLGIGEIEGIGLDNAYQAVSVLRPEWLRIRGARSVAAAADPVVVVGTGSGVTVTGSTPLISEVATIQVYVDGVHIGGLDELRTVPVIRISDLYFFSSAKATIRWGTGHPHGAILIIT